MFELMTKQAQENFRAAGLHRVVARMEKIAHGRDVGPEINLEVAVGLIGAKNFIKRAHNQQVANGLMALRVLEAGKNG